MNIELGYPELNFLKELLTNELSRIWNTKYYPTLKDKSIKNAGEEYRKFLTETVNIPIKDFPDDENCCRALLRKVKERILVEL